jgi:hypothetical protein
MTERTLGAKAGHLELLKGGKKKKDLKGKEVKGQEDEVKKGGSKKFGWRSWHRRYVWIVWGHMAGRERIPRPVEVEKQAEKRADEGDSYLAK